MKKNLITTLLICLALGSASVQATVLYWSGNGTTLGGGGTWNTTNLRWGTSTSGPFSSTWVNANSDTATLWGSDSTTPGGAVVIGTPITINGTLQWEQTPGTQPSYTINGSSTTTFSAGSTINCVNASGTGNAVGSLNSPYAGTITKTGTSQVAFNNSNGGVTKFIMNAGTADFASFNRFGSGPDVADFLTFNGGQMRVNTTTAWTMGRSITVNSGNGTITSSSATITITQDKPITWNNGTLTVRVVPLVLSSTASSGTGTLTINSGQNCSCNAANVIPTTVKLTLSSGTFVMNNNSQSIKTVSSAGNISLGSGTLTLNNPAGDSYTGVISGSGGLTKAGTGAWTSSGNNSYTGTTTLSAGTMTLSGNNTGTGAITITTGTLNLNGSNANTGNTTINSTGKLVIGASGSLSSSPIIVASNALLDVSSLDATIRALSGAGVVTNDVHALTVNGNANATAGQLFNLYSCFSGVITNGSLVKGGTHAMALRGVNSLSGSPAVTLSGGTLSVGAGPDRLPAATVLSVGGGALFQLDANNQTVASLGGSGNLNLGGGRLTVDPGASDTFGGVIQNSELVGSSTATGHGLRGYYYTNIDFTMLGVVRDDSTITFTNISDMPAYPSLARTNQISTRWLGQVLTTVAGSYTFAVRCDDGQRLWVNGVLLADDWATHGLTTKSGAITLAANARYDIVMEWFNNGSGGGAELLWTPPGDTGLFIIPTANLFLPGAGQLVKGGGGTQALSVANLYSGGTTVNAGTLQSSTDGALGAGNVAVNDGATLQIDTAASISASADLLLNGSAPNVFANFFGTGNIHALSFNGGSTYEPAGTYGPFGSGATHEDARFTGSGILNVTAAPSSTALATSGSPVVYGSSVTFTATVTGAAPTPTGTVNFYEGANFIGSGVLNGSGVATLAYNHLSVTASPHSITAVYSGDTAHSPSTSAAVSETTTIATLTPAPVIANKIYDGTNTATIGSVTFGGIIDSDTNYVNIAGSYTATFDTKDVGTGKTVSISGLVLGGSLSGNYQLSTTSLNTTANITTKNLTVTGIAASGRIYDSTTTATITGTPALQAAETPPAGTTADGKPYTGDTVTLGGSPVGAFSTKAVGTNKTVTVTGLSISGAQAFDYALPNPTLTANITNLATAVTGLTANSKPYDGGTVATLSGTATNTPSLFAGDAVTLGGTPVATFATAAAGTGKAVTVTGYALSGTDSTNYSLSQPSGLTANINQVGTTTVLTSSANPGNVNTPITFTATVTTAVPNTNSPTGTVQFFTNSLPVSSAIALTNVSPSVARASFTMSFATAGTYSMQANYSGDANDVFGSGTLSETISAIPCSGTNTILSIVDTGTNKVLMTMLGTPNAQYYMISNADVSVAAGSWTKVVGSTNTAGPDGKWTFLAPSGSGNRNFRSVAIQACP
jgi:autotransporter-associated beta strand protein